MKEEKFTIIFSADSHGNMVQYTKLFEKSFLDKARALILGGDIVPKDDKRRTPEGQRNFLEKEFFPLIKDFNSRNLKRGHKCDIFIILGNDDFISNIKILEEEQGRVGFSYINNKCVELNKGIQICGYSYVPLTPFIHKGWEKLDTANAKDDEWRKDILIEGIVEYIGEEKIKRFDLNERSDTIENDLKKLFCDSEEKGFVFVCHSPPYGTNLDVIHGGAHVGSIAVKNAIIEKKPLISLHGHIHETLANSGDYKERIGKTISVSCANHNIGDSVAIIKFDLNNLDSLERIVI